MPFSLVFAVTIVDDDDNYTIHACCNVSRDDGIRVVKVTLEVFSSSRLGTLQGKQ